MMAGKRQRNKASSRELLSNYRLLCKKAMLFRAVQCASMKRRRQAKRKRTDSHSDESVKKSKSSKDVQNQDSTPRSTWEVDSGFSEGSPPTSGRSSPCQSTSSAATFVVALDCEMVGTGPGGSCNELARCSILDYHGNVLYDKYIRPCHPVTDYRTRWSGIRPDHLQDAMAFAQAREEISDLLEGKVVVGHSVYNDFRVLRIDYPRHMVRDTGATLLLRRLAGFPRRRRVSLKILAGKLLNRCIQVGTKGHCSVEDALAALDLYKLVACEWEWELQSPLVEQRSAAQYMQDEYWPVEDDDNSKANAS